MGGEKMNMPYLHMKYKESPTDSRRYKSWVTGSVGLSSPTDDQDSMSVHQLTERGLCTIGANNFMLFRGEE